MFQVGQILVEAAPQHSTLWLLHHAWQLMSCGHIIGKHRRWGQEGGKREVEKKVREKSAQKPR